MLHKLFHSKSRQPRNIADAIELNKRLIFTCTVCDAAAKKLPNDLLYRPKMELRSFEAVSSCSPCGATNIIDRPPLVVLTIED